MPTSSQGKAIARLNALKTGARSPTVPLPHEAADFAEFEARTLEALAPRDPIEEELARRAVALFWRLRRFSAWEAFRLSEPVEFRTCFGAFSATQTPAQTRCALEHLEASLAYLASQRTEEPTDDVHEMLVCAADDDDWKAMPLIELRKRLEKGHARTLQHLQEYENASRTRWLDLMIRPENHGGENQERADRLERSLQKQLIEVLTAIKDWRAP